MNIYIIIAILFLVGYLSKYTIAKALKNKDKGTIKKRIANQSFAAVFEKISEYSLLAGKTYLIVVLLLFLLRGIGMAFSADKFGVLQHFVGSAGDSLKAFSGTLGTIILAVALLSVLVIVYRRKKREVSGEAEKQFNEIVQQYNARTLPDISPSQEMTEIERRMTEIYKWLSLREQEFGTDSIEFIQSQKDAYAALETLQQFHARIDVERRVNLREREDVRKSLKSRIVYFITSVGFYNSITKVNGWIGKAIMIIGFIAMLGVQVHYAAHDSSASMSMEVMQKRIKEFQESFGKTGISNASLNEEDEQLLDEMAADFELAVGSNSFWGADGSDKEDGSIDSNSFLLQSLTVREKILNHFISTAGARANSKDFGTYKSLADESFNDPEGYKVHIIQTHLTQQTDYKKPQTEFGREYRTVLKEKIAKANPEKWGKLKTKFRNYTKSFTQPVSLKSVTGKLWSNITGNPINNLKLFGDNELGKAANDIVKGIGKENLKIIHENLIYKHISSISSTTPYADAWNEIKNMSNTEIFPSHEMVDLVKNKLPNLQGWEVKNMAENYSPGLKHNGKFVNTPVAEEALSKMNVESSIRTQSLQTFDDYFPAQNVDYSKPYYETKPYVNNTQARTLRTSGKSVTNGVTKTTTSKGFIYASRARNVIALRGFSRIGGVLIGSFPEEQMQVNVTDFNWTTTSEGVSFTFKSSDGNETYFGPYPQDIVLNALVYAADGRPTTATMVSAPPLHSLKILLHPALVNSQLGLDAVEIDRWVDTYQNEQIEDERTFVQICQTLYSMAHFYRLSLYKGEEGIGLMREKYKNIISMNDEVFENIKGKTLTQKNCPFYDKKEFYDPELVEVIKSSLDAQPNTMVSLNELIIDKVKKKWEGKVEIGLSGSLLIDSQNFPVEPSSYQVWSGVREVNYKLSSPLKINAAGNSTINYPFSFMVQTAFTSPTLKDALSENPEEYVDKHPWQFPLLEENDIVNRCIANSIKIPGQDQRKLQQTFNRMSQFTELQRIFRLAFEGYLGYDFPLSKLIELEKEFDKSVPYTQTPEWNYNFYDGFEAMADPNYKELMDAVNLKSSGN